MKTLLIAGALVLLSGCAATNSTPGVVAESPAAAQARDDAIQARTMEYQKLGFSARDARARAESDYDESLVAQRRAEPAARTTPR